MASPGARGTGRYRRVARGTEAPDRLIVNTSPLIFLSRVGGLPWLRGLCTGSVDTPRGVIAESAAGQDGQHILDLVAVAPRMRLLDDTAVAPVVMAWALGLGESQVLAHCLLQPGGVAVLDDAAARQCAQSLCIAVVGTLGVVLAAKRMGLITEARPIIARLLEDGLYLHPSLIAGALAEVGECEACALGQVPPDLCRNTGPSAALLPPH